MGENYKRKIATYEEVKQTFASNGDKLISTVYINGREKIQYMCGQCKKTKEVTFVQYKRGARCNACVRKRIGAAKRVPIEIVNKVFTDKGYTLLGTKYINAMTKLKYKCNKGHVTSICYTDIRCGHGCGFCQDATTRQSALHSGHGCKFCFFDRLTIGVSKESQDLFWEVYKNLSKQLQNNCLFGDLNTEIGIMYLGRYYRYDFACKATKTIIEYNGSSFHANEKMDPNLKGWHPFEKERTAQECWDYEKIKYEGMESKGYTILTIWDFEYKQNPTTTVQKCLDFINSRPIILQTLTQPISTP